MLRLIVIGLLICSALAAEKVQSKTGHCEYHGKYIPEGGDFVPAPIGFCLKIKCIKAEGNSMTLLTCPSMQLPDGGHFTAKDLTKEYPHCCPKIVHT